MEIYGDGWKWGGNWWKFHYLLFYTHVPHSMRRDPVRDDFFVCVSICNICVEAHLRARVIPNARMKCHSLRGTAVFNLLKFYFKLRSFYS